MTTPPELSKLRAKIEELYYAKRIDTDAMNELLRSLEGAPSRPRGPAPFREVPLPLDRPLASPAVSSAPTSAAPRQPSPIYFEPEKVDTNQNIKTLLLSGSAMVILATYLFVRSYWSAIPDGVKFLALVLATAGVYSAGRVLWAKQKMSKTAETFIGLGISCLLFCVYAFNVLMLAKPMSSRMAWMLGSVAVALGAGLTLSAVRTFSMGLLLATGVTGALWLGPSALSWSPQAGLLAAALGVLALTLLAAVLSSEETRKGLLMVTDLSGLFVGVGLVSHGFFWREPSLWGAIGAVLVVGVSCAIQARKFSAVFAYPAGISFIATVILLLHQLGVPSHQFGLYLIPSAVMAGVRAWFLEKSGRQELAAPYFQLSQLTIVLSIGTVLRIFQAPDLFSFPLALAILLVAIAGYIVMGTLYRSPFFTFAAVGTLLLLSGVNVFHYHLSFDSACLVFFVVGFSSALISLALPKQLDQQVSGPMNVTGVASFTLALFALGGAWADQWLTGGNIRLLSSPEQVSASLWVAGLGALGYLLLARVHRLVALVYPALASASLFCLLLLHRLSVPIDVWHVSWIVPAVMAVYYLCHALDYKDFGRCFALWGEVAFVLVSLGILLTNPAQGLTACVLLLVSFAPALLIGSADLVACAVAAAYLSHFMWVKPGSPANYALQLVLMNSAVVFVRGLLTYFRPQVDVRPLRVAAVLFAGVSLCLSIFDSSISWQVFLAHGILGTLASLFLYEGRYLGFATSLFLGAYELYLSHIGVTSVEARWMPAGLFFLTWGVIRRDHSERDLLYLVGQLLLYLPSFFASLSQPWGIHGMYVGGASLAVMIFGLQFRQRLLVLGGCGMMLMNGVVQSREILKAIPRWLVLATSGGLLVSLGAIFEFRREWIGQMRESVKRGIGSLQ